MSFNTLDHFIIFVIALIVVITLHEASHAYFANRLGDPTAKYEGRVTLNPLKHLDLLGTIMLFVVGFGWGKPVNINAHNFKNPTRDSALVALAGPAANFATALVLSVPLNYFPQIFPFQVNVTLMAILDLSLLLGVFNFIPFPPLDGSKIFALFIPQKYHNRYFAFLERTQVYFLIFILLDIFVLLRIFGFSFLWLIIGNAMDLLKMIIFLGG